MTTGNEETFQDRYNKRVRQENQAFENDPIAKAQAALDWRLERQRAGEAAERAERRRLKRELDPFDWGHWGPWD